MDIDLKSTRLVQVRKTSEGMELIQLIETDRAVPLSQVLEERQIKITKLISFIPRHLVTAKIITLPTTEPLEVKEMIKYEMDGLLPYPLEQLIYDYCILETEETGYSRVMVFIAQKEILENHLALLREEGLEPDMIQVSTVALFNWFLASEGSPDRPTAILNIADGTLDLAISREGRLIFSRGVKVEGEDKDLKLVSETKRSIAIYRKEANGKPISNMVLSGTNNLDSLDHDLT